MLIVYIVNLSVIGLAVGIHYEFLHQFSNLMPRLSIAYRSRIVLGVFGALLAHCVEVWIFAGSYYLMHHAEGWGYLAGNFDGSLLDCVYFSFTTFTTVGFGDIEPYGDLRFLAGLEALTGLLLITWSASYLYLTMTDYWGKK